MRALRKYEVVVVESAARAINSPRINSALQQRNIIRSGDYYLLARAFTHVQAEPCGRRERERERLLCVRSISRKGVFLFAIEFAIIGAAVAARGVVAAGARPLLIPTPRELGVLHLSFSGSLSQRLFLMPLLLLLRGSRRREAAARWCSFFFRVA